MNHHITTHIRGALGIALVLAIGAPATGAHASPLGGSKCEAPGAARRANNGRFVCSPEGGRSIWRRVGGSLSVVDVAEALRGYSTFAYALRQSGLDEELATGGPYTIFAPRNAAFLALPSGTLDALLRPDNLAALRRILRHHVVRGTLTAAMLRTGSYDPLDATPLRVVVHGGVRVDDARVTVADVLASNGVLHGLSRVLIPAGTTITP
jgi:uncharacterized surface protein with fasciclin (FAS1) repeats